jgi:hypothetical protein
VAKIAMPYRSAIAQITKSVFEPWTPRERHTLKNSAARL